MLKLIHKLIVNYQKKMVTRQTNCKVHTEKKGSRNSKEILKKKGNEERD
jgi:hypothetical protein